MKTGPVAREGHERHGGRFDGNNHSVPGLLPLPARRARAGAMAGRPARVRVPELFPPWTFMHHLPEHLCQGTCVGVRLRAEAFSRLVLACRGLGKLLLLLLLMGAISNTRTHTVNWLFTTSWSDHHLPSTCDRFLIDPEGFRPNQGLFWGVEGT